MAGSSLFLLIDDIASILDDVALMTKTATQKTAGVLGDDLALNAEQVAGVNADRELPVVFAVAKGSLINKAILVPAALAISAFIPWAIKPLLMVGGGFLCFEGVEKITHKLFHKEDEDAEHGKRVEAIQDPSQDMVAFEAEKIKGAIRTDFILSAELIVIALGTFADAPLSKQVITLIVVAVVMTIGVYGLVAAIVKLDDFGLYMTKKGGGAKTLGDAILRAAPYLMRGLSIVGTIAMFLVGGGIMVHGLPVISELGHAIEHKEGIVAAVGSPLFNGFVGVIVGAIILAVVTGIKKIIPKKGDDAGAH